ncbi:MAG: CrcB family protein [Paracoccaceae bacterium]
MITTVLQVALGGAIGAVARLFVGISVTFPYGTLSVNIVGSFLIGLAFVALAQAEMVRWAPLLMTGILGGFTTFSAFSLDAFRLYETGRIVAAGGYVLASVGLSVLALIAGVIIMRSLQG